MRAAGYANVTTRAGTVANHTARGRVVEDLLTVAQAAAILGMRARSVRTAIAAGRLRATRLGPRAIVLRRQDVEAYRATPRHPGGRPPGQGRAARA